jgi:serine/threonine-protein kinase RsbW
LQSVDQAETLVTEAARNLGFDEDALHEVGVSMRESMVNAVAHGNRYSAKKKVHLKVWSDDDALFVEIGDEGRGFEQVTVPDPLAEENLMKHSGRGLLMIQAFMDEFVIGKREPSGTLVRLVKRLPKQHN